MDSERKRENGCALVDYLDIDIEVIAKSSQEALPGIQSTLETRRREQQQREVKGGRGSRHRH